MVADGIHQPNNEQQRQQEEAPTVEQAGEGLVAEVLGPILQHGPAGPLREGWERQGNASRTCSFKLFADALLPPLAAPRDSDGEGGSDSEWERDRGGGGGNKEGVAMAEGSGAPWAGAGYPVTI